MELLISMIPRSHSDRGAEAPGYIMQNLLKQVEEKSVIRRQFLSSSAL